MCGIAGFWDRPADPAALLTERAGCMADTLRHRGPDDDGVWVDEEAGIGLGFRRLSIIDLSPLGHQPMVSVEQRYTIVFNGEIYNYRELKQELASAGHGFRGGSDTEVILAGCSRWGIEQTLRRISGMFALAIWDGQARTLTLARDRVGKKPLYYGRAGDSWLFGSELKALRAHPAFHAQIDREALTEYLRFSYVPAPRSIYKGIHKLPPAHFVTLSRGSAAVPAPYWSASAAVADGLRAPLELTDAEAIEQLDAQLRDAVAHRMIADVPLGAFLSGGLDSSIVVALMQAQSATPVKTFTIGFDVPGYNEAEAAKAVALHLGTDHTELYVRPEQAQGVIPLLALMYDEPFADSSQIPTYLVSQLARTKVTVALSGDGGDELFAGYNRYFWAPAIWKRARPIPSGLRRALCAAVSRTPARYIDRAYAAIEPVLGGTWRVHLPGDKLHKLAGVLSAADPMELYLRLTSAWHHPTDLVIGEPDPAGNGHRAGYLPDGFLERMMYLDLLTYLPDDILVKVDRASMSVGLEVRAPLLDHRLVEWAWKLAPSLRVRNGQPKWLLRQVLHRYVPKPLVERPKMGFGVPIDTWLRGPLRDWAEELLTPTALEAGGLLRSEPIRRVWRQHLEGHRNEQARLWPILMFQAWRREWLA